MTTQDTHNARDNKTHLALFSFTREIELKNIMYSLLYVIIMANFHCNLHQLFIKAAYCLQYFSKASAPIFFFIMYKSVFM